MNALLVTLALLAADPISPGDHTRTIDVDGRNRSYLIHVPKKYDPKTPTPVVLIFHGAGTNAQIMVPFCEMSKKSDEAGFIAVYPNGTGTAGIFLTWNAGGLHGRMAEGKADDVKFVGSLLDDLGTVVNADPKRVYATGMSNGGMMCYRLAAELSDRIAVPPMGQCGQMTAGTAGRFCESRLRFSATVLLRGRYSCPNWHEFDVNGLPGRRTIGEHGMLKQISPLLLAVVGLTGCASSNATEKESTKMSKPLSFTMKSLDGKDVDLIAYQGKVVLIVNVASKCGLTPQYDQLQELHDKYAEDGLAVLGLR